jgi:hypothetical protein
MNDKTQLNPFRPPSAQLDPPAAAPDALFFTASPAKFVIMSIATFGFYDLYWFYKNWRTVRTRTGRSISPFWRAFFSVIWSYGCFKEIAMGTEAAASRANQAIGLAFLYILLNVASRLPDPYWLVSLGTFVPVMVANGWAREANERIESGYPENASFSGWNWAAIILGGALIALAIIGAFLPETP